MGLFRLHRAAATLIVLFSLAAGGRGEDVIVFTAYQNFDSRIYIMSMDGTVYDWFQYDYHRLCDLEVVEGEVHVAEAFAPRSYVLDIQTGQLELVIDDWSLYYFYDLAYDGEYLYVTEWNMNRYLPDGSGGSSASFDLDVLGSAWADDRLWTLNDDGLIRAWDTSGWPELTQDTSLTLEPPSPDCRGLSHDGEYFWTAESIESQTGFIYRFNSSGMVVTQLPEPAFRGWSACVAPGYQSDLSSRTWAGIKGGFGIE